MKKDWFMLFSTMALIVSIVLLTVYFFLMLNTLSQEIIIFGYIILFILLRYIIYRNTPEKGEVIE